MASRKPTPPDVHLNLNVRGMSPSATLAINERSAQLQREGREVYRFGLGQSPFPVAQSVVEALQANAHQKDYLAVKGLRELRGAVADYHRRRLQVDRAADDVLIGPGSKELMFLLQLVYYGDLVIPTPSWVSYAPQADIIGRKIRWIETRSENDWRMTPDDLERLCHVDPHRPRIVILNYPSNPTGSTYTADELRAIARVAKKYRVVMLSDEIYGELHFQGRHVSIARFYPEGTIVSTGLSKWCGAGGWRLGTFVFPHDLRWLLDSMAAVASETYTSTSAPIQYAAVRAFEGGLDIEEYLTRSRRVVRAVGKECARRLRRAGARLPEPKGGFYVMFDAAPFRDSLHARGIETASAMCQTLLDQTGVAVLPGSAFGVPNKVLAARLAFVDFDGAAALNGAAQVPPDKDLNGAFLDAYCSKVLRGVDTLCEWLRA